MAPAQCDQAKWLDELFPGSKVTCNMNKSTGKVFILGLDGATFDLLNPMMAQTIIPNIKEICENGAWGPMESIFPPVTAPAWLAMATGLNPGKTGVYDYINKADANREEFAPISSAYYKGRALWDFIGQKNFKVGIYNYPTLSPPPVVNGFAVTGIGQYGKEDLCYPKELAGELNSVANGYEYALNLRAARYRKDINAFFQDINRILSKQTAALKHLVKNKPWDFFFAVFSFTDWMQHVLWDHLDENYPSYKPDIAQKVRDQFEAVWASIDSFIGELKGLLPHGTNLILVSDHGAGPLKSVFYPNSWLEKKGWLKRKNLGWKKPFISSLKLFSEGSDNKYFSYFGHLIRDKFLRIHGSMDLIDLDSSLAYSPEHNTMFGCVNLTSKGKMTKGFKEGLTATIRNLPNEVPGIYNVNVHLPEHIYKGPHVNLSPDIFFIVNNYESTVEIDLSTTPFVSSPSIPMRTGGHLPNGIFAAFGDAFKQCEIPMVSILDIAPTILSLFGLPLIDDMDGRVLSEALTTEVLANLKTENRSGYDQMKVNDHSSKGDMEEMKKMLKSLGYM
jgi:predicted AlkP superfamily phosphohydrolase/phosphomutase